MKNTTKLNDLCTGSTGCEKTKTVTEPGEGCEAITDNERRKGLVLLLGAIRKNHKRAVPRIVGAIDTLIHVIDSHEIAIADWNRSGTVFNRQSIIQYIGDVFDPLLEEVIPVGSLAWITLDEGGTPLPLSDHLKSKKNLPRIADNLKSAAQVLEDNYHVKINDWSNIVNRGESLSAVAEILYAIWDALPSDTLQWCSACFRRTHANSKYCGLHTPSHIADNDSIYRYAIKLKKSLPSDVLKAWERYNRERRVLGESFELICNLEDVPISIHFRGKLTSPELKIMVEKSLQSPWSVAFYEWKHLLSSLQYASLLINRSPSEFNNWDDFSTYILQVLDDRDEDSRHPLWIFNILLCAEDWLKAERGNLDGRTTDTESRVVDLFRNGITDPKELVKRFSMSKKTIYGILNRNGLRK
jgi:hypothetical protein